MKQEHVDKALKVQDRLLFLIKQFPSENDILFLCAGYNAELVRCYQEIDKLKLDKE